MGTCGTSSGYLRHKVGSLELLSGCGGIYVYHLAHCFGHSEPRSPKTWTRWVAQNPTAPKTACRDARKNPRISENPFPPLIIEVGGAAGSPEDLMMPCRIFFSFPLGPKVGRSYSHCRWIERTIWGPVVLGRLLAAGKALDFLYVAAKSLSSAIGRGTKWSVPAGRWPKDDLHGMSRYGSASHPSSECQYLVPGNSSCLALS